MTTVWIDDGCIACAACVEMAPEIFALDAGDGCLVVGRARLDGRDSDNGAERSPLRPEVAARFADDLADAAAGCPTGCVKIA